MCNDSTRPFSGFFNPGGAPGSYNAAGNTEVGVKELIMCIHKPHIYSYKCMLLNVLQGKYMLQIGQHEPCKGECCPVWVLQQICWISLGK